MLARQKYPENTPKGPCQDVDEPLQSLVLASALLAVRVVVRVGLLGRLLLLALALLLASVAGQGLLENLENLLVGNLLVRLDLAEVQLRGATELGQAVLGEGCGGLAALHRLSVAEN